MIAKAILFALCLVLSTISVSAISVTARQPQPYLPAQALELERVGKWQEALAVWENWQLAIDCPVDDRLSLKTYHIALCLHHLGQTRQAAFLCLQDTFHNGFAAPDTALLLLEFYQAAGQVGDLRQIMETFEQTTLVDHANKGYLKNSSTTQLLKSLPTRTIRDALDIVHLQKNRKTLELITIAQSSSWTSSDTTDPRDHQRNWRCRLAAQSLAELGDDSIPVIKDAILEPKANISWLIYALGKSKSTNALPTLVLCARDEQSYNRVDYISAISMHGEEGSKLIHQISEWSTLAQRSIASMAKEYLAAPEKFSPPVASIPITVPPNTRLLKSYTIPKHLR